MYKAFLILVISFLLFACSTKHETSLIRLCNGDSSIAVEKVSFKSEDIKNLNGKFVQIEDFFNYTLEDVALYPSKSASCGKALWLNFIFDNSTLYNSLEKLSGKKVLVIGKVDTWRHGSFLAKLDSTFCIKEIK